MSDIVERLAVCAADYQARNITPAPVYEARAEITRLREALSSETAAREKAERERDELNTRLYATQCEVNDISWEHGKLTDKVADLTRKLEAAAGALDGVYTYCNDTLSGRADGGPDDRAWQREAVIRARDLARPFARPEIEASLRAREAHAALKTEEKSR